MYCVTAPARYVPRLSFENRRRDQSAALITQNRAHLSIAEDLLRDLVSAQKAGGQMRCLVDDIHRQRLRIVVDVEGLLRVEGRPVVEAGDAGK